MNLGISAVENIHIGMFIGYPLDHLECRRIAILADEYVGLPPDVAKAWYQSVTCRKDGYTNKVAYLIFTDGAVCNFLYFHDSYILLLQAEFDYVNKHLDWFCKAN